MPKPPLKWVGGKQAIADRLITCFPETMGTYYEPFLGAGSVLLSLRPLKAIVGDLNGWILDTYQAIAEDYERVADSLDALTNTKEEYLRIRAIDPNTLDLFQRAAHLIYLNKTGFRGLFRVNRKGQFNVPYGAYQRRYYDLENLKEVSIALARVQFRHGDFADCLVDTQAGDFVYLDPPYYKQGGYSDFNRYTEFQFKEKDHHRLADVCRSMGSRGVLWALSNSDTPFVRDLFSLFHFYDIDSRREINLNSTKRDIKELLITNYPVEESAWTV